MSIDTWAASSAAPAEPLPVGVLPSGAARTDAAEAAPASPTTAIPDVPPARAVAEAHRSRIARRVTVADAGVAVAASAAGLVVGYAEGESVPELAALVIGANLFWFLRLWRSRPMAVPLLRLGTPELRQVLVTAQLVYGPLVVLELLFPQLLPHALFVASAPVGVLGALLVRLRFRRSAAAAAAVPTLVVGGFASATASARSLLRADTAGARVVGVCLPANDAVVVDALEIAGVRIPVVGTDRTVLDAVRETGSGLVVLTATDSLGPDDLRELMWQLAAEGVELVVAPGLPDVAGSRMVTGSVGRTPMTHVAAPRPARSHGPGKRALDLVVAGAGLLVAAPVMLAIAVAVKIDSRGPVLYRAQRVGAGGEAFDMIKFRSMYVDADTRRAVLADANMGAGPLFKVKNDPRVTRVGRFIRRYSLDELPQFFNVLGGSMSVVGPRPALAHEVEQYPPVMLRRMLVKPGVTGAWQVSGRSNLSWDESIRLDVGYVENWSLGADVGIIARTVRTVLTSDGAY
ncbi:sugar transferase [Tsukamurella paurometabola]|uniref:Colanic biosynthesis UDP-glucose lipid carrier transferase n=1 Tax=Tsukamurella paurometabola TaxID=2061 RepID=A0A3P8L1C3_TSUPA|nr:sugar transferase [Tsukamurella paurometabola]UEA81344.1 sugar transferase [Tsukamurella paurometabola]VDR38325.1 Putative colanic biosynthesis UDP-glucose lipid carrier transferase [Tsukamurella paurometabola]